MDLQAYDRIVEQQVVAGVDGLVIGGTTGEGQLMSWDEHIMCVHCVRRVPMSCLSHQRSGLRLTAGCCLCGRLIAHTVNQFGRDLLVIGNTGSNATREAVHATEQGFAVGMHAALQINPYYGKTSRSGLLNHFHAVLNEGPGILYNVPGRTGQDIPDDVVLELASHANFLGVKECTGNQRIQVQCAPAPPASVQSRWRRDSGRGMRQAYAAHGVSCWSGNDDEAHAARHTFGAQGVISVAANVVPSLYVRLMRKQNDELADSLQELIAWLFCEPNPIPINTALVRHALPGQLLFQCNSNCWALRARLGRPCAAWYGRSSGCRTCRSAWSSVRQAHSCCAPSRPICLACLTSGPWQTAISSWSAGIEDSAVS